MGHLTRLLMNCGQGPLGMYTSWLSQYYTWLSKEGYSELASKYHLWSIISSKINKEKTRDLYIVLMTVLFTWNLYYLYNVPSNLVYSTKFYQIQGDTKLASHNICSSSLYKTSFLENPVQCAE